MCFEQDTIKVPLGSSFFFKWTLQPCPINIVGVHCHPNFSRYFLTTTLWVPDLKFPLINNSEFDLHKENPKSFNLIVFYRGLHCPLCLLQIKELGRLQKDYQEKGVEIVVVSSDTKERAEEFATKVAFPDLKFGYGLNLTDAKKWGLYISEGIGKTSIGIEEPAKFSEPGIFLIKPDKTLYYGATQTMPFARPSFAELIKAVEFSITKNYPARGEFTSDL